MDNENKKRLLMVKHENIVKGLIDQGYLKYFVFARQDKLNPKYRVYFFENTSEMVEAIDKAYANYKSILSAKRH